LAVVDVASLSSEDGQWRLLRFDYPRKTRAAEVLSGTLTDKAEALYRRLMDRSLIH
jgi:hypothetical protein